MNKKFYSVALITVLCLAAAGCQKETIVEQDFQVQQNAEIRRLVYTVDGAVMHVTLHNNQEYQRFVNWMLALAREGHKVTFRNECASSNTSQSKDVVVFVTTDEVEANTWCQKMTDLNYEVTMEYDPRTGKYTCTAVR